MPLRFRRRVIAVRTLSAGDDDLLKPEQLAGPGLQHADLRAGGAAVPWRTDYPHVEPMLRRQVVAINRDGLAALLAFAADDVEIAVAIDIAKAEPLIDRRPSRVVDTPF